MGRPISQCPGEIRGTIERAEYMLSIAQSSLADVSLAESDKPGFKRYIKKEPVGLVLIIVPWNFPYLVAINSVLPALIAGNAVLMKASPQTPLVADRFASLFASAGLPANLLTPLHLSPTLTQHLAAHPSVKFVSFTGSVAGGRGIERAAAGSETIKGVALELGGKDPAYVRADADVEYSIGEIVDGAIFNSGQSCCAIERVYVHEAVYDVFVKGVEELVKKYKLGDPSDPSTTLGPVISPASAQRIEQQVNAAVNQGAKALIRPELFPVARPGTAYVQPQVLVNVNHDMEVMMEETFGPVIPIMKVSSDEQALELMNDSKYGLTASIWTKSDPTTPEIQYLLDNIESGTVFLNRADYLDPALAWGGLKDSGRGVSLSKFGYDQLVRLKSVHLKTC